MKDGIHPQYFTTTFNCINCGTTYELWSTINPSNGPVKVEICSHCHPAYNKGKVIEVKASKGRLQEYEERLARMKAAQSK
jgi:ribosomal protein L31